VFGVQRACFEIHRFIILRWISKQRLPLLLRCAASKVLLPLLDLCALEPCLKLQPADVFFGEDTRRSVRKQRPHEYEYDGLIEACHLLQFEVACQSLW
jgi:hypothetical protein